MQIISAAGEVEAALRGQFAPPPPPPALPEALRAMHVSEGGAPPRPPPPQGAAPPPRPPPPADTDDEGEDIFQRQPHPSHPILVSSLGSPLSSIYLKLLV